MKKKVGMIKPTTIALQMEDRSLSYPKGIIEDVLIKANDFIFSVDSAVLDMEEDNHVPLVLGRSVLATGRALIDVKNGELTLRANDEWIIFFIYQDLKQLTKLISWKNVK